MGGPGSGPRKGGGRGRSGGSRKGKKVRIKKSTAPMPSQKRIKQIVAKSKKDHADFVKAHDARARKINPKGKGLWF